ncbi:hypothetical protein V8D89_004117 [Ganoderma adspersum]
MPLADKHGNVVTEIPIRKEKSVWGDRFDINPSWHVDGVGMRLCGERTLSNLSQSDGRVVPGVWSHLFTFLGRPHACIGYRFSLVECTSISALRALETVVFVEPPQDYPPTGPTLWFCPDAQHPSASLTLRTLRLVYGNCAHRPHSPPVDGVANRFDLSRMLGGLETGAYGCFDTLVLETKPGLDVSLEDLERLKRHLATVERRYYVGRTPTMPLPDYCAEPYGGSGERRAHSSASSESIADVANILTELAATLREDLNSRIPLFKLPVEIVQKILEQVPSPLFEDHNDFRPSWHSSAMHTDMLVPVLHTCRQLRRIALSHLSLWKTISTTLRFHALPPILRQKDSEIPLIAIIESVTEDDSLDSLDEILDPHRMQELHIHDLQIHHLPDDIVAKINRYFSAGLPLLESLSLSQVSTSDEEDEEINEDECPFPLDDAPILRHMMLEDVSFIPKNAFPHLTHLTLSDIHTPGCHTKIANLLSRCPNLESLVICFPYVSDMPPDLPEGLPPSLNLNRLRRVTLELPQFCDPIMDFYLSLFPLDGPACQPTAFQILELAEMDDAAALGQMLSRVTKAEASHLSLALHPRPGGRDQMYLNVSAAGPKGTFHAATESFLGVDVEPRREELDASPQRFPLLDAILCGCVHLRAVREVWVTSVPPRTGKRLSRGATEHFRSTIAALPALETVVVVVAAVGAQLDVDLGLLPSVRDPGFASPNLKTLRIVHGSGAHTGRGPVEKVRLTKLLDQLGTGAYGYFENVVLQMTRRLAVNGKDLARLEAHFGRVTFQHIHSMPTMPLPEYCTEPCAGPGGSSVWHGSLW